MVEGYLCFPPGIFLKYAFLFLRNSGTQFRSMYFSDFHGVLLDYNLLKFAGISVRNLPRNLEIIDKTFAAFSFNLIWEQLKMTCIDRRP